MADHSTIDHTTVVASAFIGCKAYNNTTQSVGSGSTTALTLNSEDYDSDTMHDNSSNTSRVILKKVGVWRITGHAGVYANNNTTGIRAVWLRLNGSTAIEGSEFRLDLGTGYQDAGSITVDVEIASITDYVEMVMFQSSGGNLTIGDSGAGNEAHFTSLSAHYLGTP